MQFSNVKCTSLIILTIFYYGFCAIFRFLSLLRTLRYLHSLFVTSRIYEPQISINDIGSRRFLFSCVIYPTTCYIFRYSSFFPPFFFSPFTVEDYTGKSFVVRERAPSRFVFRLWRSKDRSSLPSVRELRQPREIVCVSTKLDRFNLERASWRPPTAILEVALDHIYVYICIHTYVYKQASSSGGPPTEI